MSDDIEAMIAAAERMLCPKGMEWTGDDNRGDHGHTDCWAIGGLLNEIERLRAEVARLGAFLHPIGEEARRG